MINNLKEIYDTIENFDEEFRKDMTSLEEFQKKNKQKPRSSNETLSESMIFKLISDNADDFADELDLIDTKEEESAKLTPKKQKEMKRESIFEKIRKENQKCNNFIEVPLESKIQMNNLKFKENEINGSKPKLNNIDDSNFDFELLAELAEDPAFQMNSQNSVAQPNFANKNNFNNNPYSKKIEANSFNQFEDSYYQKEHVTVRKNKFNNNADNYNNEYSDEVSFTPANKMNKFNNNQFNNNSNNFEYFNEQNNNNYNNNSNYNNFNNRFMSPVMNEAPQNYGDVPDYIEYSNDLKNYELARNKDWTGPFAWDTLINEANLRIFGFTTFRENQREIINASMSGRDIFVCMPTGGGKSLTFQIPALVQEGVTIVVMPLLSLIVDQTSYLEGLGQNVCFLRSDNEGDLFTNYYKYFKSNKEEERLKIIFATPEKLLTDRTQRLLRKLYNDNLIERLVIDEAHCMLNWGHDFRPNYLELKKFRPEFPKVPIMGITATATNGARSEIIKNLNMSDTLFFRSSYNRPNLNLQIINKKDVADQLKYIEEFIRTHHKKHSGIIYCSSKKECENVTKKLKEKKLSIDFYHAGMNSNKREMVQTKWKNDEIRVIVATIAFGMGINKNDVRFVIHYSMPKSLENYYQEIGRAGRDSQLSDCILFYSPGDRKTYEYLIGQQNLSEKRMIVNLRRVNEIMEFCEDDCECRRVLALRYFDEIFDKRKCNKMCDNCRKTQNNQSVNILPMMNEVYSMIRKYELKGGSNLTQNQLAEYLKGLGINKANAMKSSLDGFLFGHLKDYSLFNIKKIIRRMIVMKIIVEKVNKMTIRRKNKCEDVIFCYISSNPENNLKELKEVKITFSIEGNNKNKISKQKKNLQEPAADFKEKAQINDNINYGLLNKHQYEELLEILKAKRLELFGQEKTLSRNADIIFTNFGLTELAKKLPTDDEELCMNYIHGVGEKQLRQYGPKFLECINQFIEEHKIDLSKKEFKRYSKIRKSLYEEAKLVREFQSSQKKQKPRKEENDDDLLDEINKHFNEFNDSKADLNNQNDESRNQSYSFQQNFMEQKAFKTPKKNEFEELLLDLDNLDDDLNINNIENVSQNNNENSNKSSNNYFLLNTNNEDDAALSESDKKFNEFFQTQMSTIRSGSTDKNLKSFDNERFEKIQQKYLNNDSNVINEQEENDGFNDFDKLYKEVIIMNKEQKNEKKRKHNDDEEGDEEENDKEFNKKKKKSDFFRKKSLYNKFNKNKKGR